mmetsp:Transcript_19322/g.56399  ORF Transcript_19322/g.56399 Transcript_19322/m.56399 type:complete len:579 (+) Transcript_19322:493-2229(+)
MSLGIIVRIDVVQARIQQLIPQRTEGAVRPLGEEVDVAVGGALQRSVPGRPQPRDGAEEGGFSGPRGADDEQIFALPEGQIEIVNEGPLPVGGGQGYIPQGEEGTIDGGGSLRGEGGAPFGEGGHLDQFDLGGEAGGVNLRGRGGPVRQPRLRFRFRLRLRRLRLVRGQLQKSVLRRPSLVGLPYGLHELTQPIDRGRKHAQLFELIHDDAQIVQYVIERADALADHPQLDRPGEELRGDDPHGQNLDEIPVRRGEEIDVPLGDDDLSLGVDDALEAGGDLAPLDVLPGVERDRFGVVPDPDEGIAKVGLPLELFEVEADEFPSEEGRDDGAEGGVRDDGDEEVGLNGVQYEREGEEVDDGGDHSDEQGEAERREGSYVLGDALIGIVDLLPPLQRVVHPVGLVQLERPIGQPFPPRVGQFVLLKFVQHRHGHAHHEGRGVLGEHRIEFFGVLAAEGVPEIFADVREGDGDTGVEEGQSDHAREEPPARFGFLVVRHGHVLEGHEESRETFKVAHFLLLLLLLVVGGGVYQRTFGGRGGVAVLSVRFGQGGNHIVGGIVGRAERSQPPLQPQRRRRKE